MAKWKEDLASRVRRSELAMNLTGEALYDIAELEREVQLFRQVGEFVKKRKWMKGD
jgi:hypothetical protein